MFFLDSAIVRLADALGEPTRREMVAMMRRSALVAAMVMAAAVAVAAVGSVSRETSSTALGSLERRGGNDRECNVCVATFEELQSVLSAELPAGMTEITLCKSTKTTPIMLMEDLFIWVQEGATVHLRCCGSQEFSLMDENQKFRPKKAARQGRCGITRATSTHGLRFRSRGEIASSSVPWFFGSSLRFFEIVGDQFGDSILSASGPLKMVLFNRCVLLFLL